MNISGTFSRSTINDFANRFVNNIFTDWLYFLLHRHHVNHRTFRHAAMCAADQEFHEDKSPLFDTHHTRS